MRNTASFTVIVIRVSSIKPRVSSRSLHHGAEHFRVTLRAGTDKNVTAVLAELERRVAKIPGIIFPARPAFLSLSLSSFFLPVDACSSIRSGTKFYRRLSDISLVTPLG